MRLCSLVFLAQSVQEGRAQVVNDGDIINVNTVEGATAVAFGERATIHMQANNTEYSPELAPGPDS